MVVCFLGQNVEGSVLEVVLAKPAEKGAEGGYVRGYPGSAGARSGASVAAAGRGGVLPTAQVAGAAAGYPTQVVDSLSQQFDAAMSMAAAAANSGTDPVTSKSNSKFLLLQFLFTMFCLLFIYVEIFDWFGRDLLS